jgi:hypothetical protein
MSTLVLFSLCKPEILPIVFCYIFVYVMLFGILIYNFYLFLYNNSYFIPPSVYHYVINSEIYIYSVNITKRCIGYIIDPIYFFGKSYICGCR